MAEKEVTLMKGNEAIAHAAIRCGCDGYFGYPITPQSEVLETLAAEKPWETTGMVVLQAESEVASINMVYGGAATGKKVMTSSSSPGVSLMQEGMSYLAAARLPCVIVDVMRSGPGLGNIGPEQGDYFMAVKGGGHGHYHVPVIAPSSLTASAFRNRTTPGASAANPAYCASGGSSDAVPVPRLTMPPSAVILPVWFSAVLL